MSRKKKRLQEVPAKATPPAGVSRPKKLDMRVVWALVLFSLIAALVYANSFQGPFIWDDRYLIQENHFIKSFKYLADSFKNHLYYSTAGLSNFYRPLQTVLLLVDYHIWKLNPFGYHLTNLLFHILCAFFIYRLVDIIFKRRLIGFMTGLLFLVHPMNSTVVDYISSRADSQVTLFSVLSVYLFLRSIRAVNARAFYLGSLASFFLALLSKELAVIMPFLLIISIPAYFGYSASPERRAALKKTVPFFIMLAGYVLLRVTLLSWPNASNIKPPSMHIRLLTTCEAFTRLIGLMFFPTEIHIEKDLPFSSGFSQLSSMVSMGILAAIASVAYIFRKRSRMLFFGIAWFFVALIPMSSIVPINATIADHWLYLPCAGFFLACVGGAADLTGSLKAGGKKAARAALICIFAFAVLAFSIRTVRQNTVWAEPVKFYQLAIKHAPKSFRAYNEIGIIYMDQGKLDESVAQFKKAVELNTRFDQAYDNLGIAYDLKGEYANAIKAHKKAIGLNPNNAKIYNNLGNVYNKSGRFDEAVEVYNSALRMNPGYKAVYNNLGVVHYKRKDFDKARWHWEKTLEIDPDFKMARDNLAVLKRLLKDKYGIESD
ncbi:tetratricopeptide repeat protein [Candidatus Omnitrophota bacterium]